MLETSTQPPADAGGSDNAYDASSSEWDDPWLVEEFTSPFVLCPEKLAVDVVPVVLHWRISAASHTVVAQL